MPFLFERVSDASELLLPENLLQTNSPIRKMVTEIPEEDWQHIEIVGWLYQFYISEKKTQVIGKTVKSEDIPAATQLFTPNWIVKYMVQNTLGRKWLMTCPDSSIRDTMEFYSQPAEQEPEVQAQLEAITPKELHPENLTFMDPACGSGHILAEAYDLFKEIYLERGYRTRDIPRHILELNLYGLDIDDRAAQLARFTVLMKARADDRHILNPDRPVTLNVISIQESKGLDLEELAGTLLKERTVEVGKPKMRQQYLVQPTKEQAYLKGKEKPEVSQDELKSLLHLFQDAKTFGSLLTVPDKVKDALPRLEKLIEKALTWDEYSKSMSRQLLPLVRQARLLATEYDFVVANPPYMGNKGFNAKLKEFANSRYPNSKSDLFAMFIERNLDMAQPQGYAALITMHSWMFLSSFEKLRSNILDSETIIFMAHLGARAFDSISGEIVQTTAFVLYNEKLEEYKGTYLRLVEEKSEEAKVEAIRSGEVSRYTASGNDFNKIPRSPIVYWVSDKIRNIFSSVMLKDKYNYIVKCIYTGDYEKFIRLWYEVENNKIGWKPYNKSGGSRKWYGLAMHILDWKNNGASLKKFEFAGLGANQHYNTPHICWSCLTSWKPSFRDEHDSTWFDDVSPAIVDSNLNKDLLCFLNSKIASELLKILNPTLHYQAGDIKQLPYPDKNLLDPSIRQRCVEIATYDWNIYETSWDFEILHILQSDQGTIKKSYTMLQSDFSALTAEMKFLEEKNNRIFIETYGLQDELTPDVPLEEITLTCNPYYRYGGNKSEEELEALLRADTIKELISCKHSEDVVITSSMCYIFGDCFGADACRRLLAMTGCINIVASP